MANPVAYPLNPPYRLIIMVVGMIILSSIAIIWVFSSISAPVWSKIMVVVVFLLLTLSNLYRYVRYFPQALFIHDQRISYGYKGQVISINHPPILGDRFICVPRTRLGPWLRWWIIPSECLTSDQWREIRRLCTRLHQQNA